MILVTGANGHFGKAAIELLLSKGVKPGNISGLVRDEAKGAELKAKGVALRIADYDNYASMVNALKGVDKLLLVSGNDMEKRSQQQQDAVKAAQEAGVKQIVYTSFERTNETETSPIAVISLSHLGTEKLIRESGIPYTILRNNFYLDFLPMVLGEKVLEQGIFFPAGEGRPALALRKEMAEAAVNVLLTSGHENKEYNISGSEQVSFMEIAAMLSEITGKKVIYTSPDGTTYVDVLTKAGVPKGFAELFAGFGEVMKLGELSPAKSDLEKLLGRKPTTVKQFLKEIYSK